MKRNGRLKVLANQATHSSSCCRTHLYPKAPPTSGDTTRTRPCSRSRHCASTLRIMCGTCVALTTTSWSAWWSQYASTALPSIGTMHWRARSILRRTTTSACAAYSSNCLSALSVTKTLSRHCSCSRSPVAAWALSTSAYTGRSS
ncbi:hypothetical protein D3C71_1743470 [compost metagenome]